ncbi:MAG: DUF1553 domain-containing protein [Pirellulaceae bacterium]|nr:DUF1553 domain-containing protein [Pirellulaceae bacterium]
MRCLSILTFALGAALLLTVWLPASSRADDAPRADEASRADDARRAEQVEFFEAKIRPVLVQHCQSCHAAGADVIQGGLRLDSRAATLAGGDSGPALVPGKPDESLLLAALRYEGPEMPPKGKLPAAVIADFERWIRDGAVDPRDEPGGTVAGKKTVDFAAAREFWAFQPPRKAALPEVSDAPAIAGDVDRFVVARLEAAGLAPNPRADARTLVRRAYFDLLGLPPTPEAVERFVEDSARDPHVAWQRLIDELLESPHYGERWARHWLDVARYAEDQAHTFKARKYPRGYYYRDWVVRSLNDDLPYDQFLRQQIAGDLLPGPERHERLAALGLFALGPVYYAENVEKDKANADEWDDRVDTLMRGVLGLTASCARCHDHKFDPITMQDYYGLAGIFASSRYEERPIVSDEVLAQRRAADAHASQQQVAIERLLADESRRLRPELVDDIPRYVVAAWQVLNRRQSKDKQDKNDKKLLEEIAKRQQVSPTLLGRWVEYLAADDGGAAGKDAGKETAGEREHLSAWRELLASRSGSQQDLSRDEEKLAAALAAGEQLRDAVRQRLPHREELLGRFGESVAFVADEDRAVVPPGQIPLGNLFDDSGSVPLDAALATDKFRAVASENSLGVDRVALGWGARTEIAPGIQFDFSKLGSDGSQFGAVANDAWFNSGGIRTTGQAGAPGERAEQGIGMHANALITFDLDEIRRAGLLPPGQRFVFRVDRAGLNDDVFGSTASSVHLAVIVSRPHRDKGVTDAILASYVNGQPRELATDDFTYYIAGEAPQPLRADGKFVSFEIPLGPEARYLTLVATGAGGPDDNPINSDHAVFSAARLELDPPPVEQPVAAGNAVAGSQGQSASDPATERQDRADAVLLSRMFYDEGLLALPPADAEARLPQPALAELQQLRQELQRRQQAAESIEVPLAHSLAEGQGTDLSVYLQGDPARRGEQAPRALPAIFTGGEKRPFDPSGSGRLELALAIASPDNPLTARVIVNRVWAGHFGAGLVRTTSNFGQLGDRPSHPELLDYLAVRLVEEGWSLKWLHRQIMRSATYQQASDFDARKFEADPENRLLWRMNRRRLEIEPWRDALLAVTGELDRSLGGPSVELEKGDNHRRTLYGFVSRHKLDELLRLFDFPDPNITAARRTVTTVPLQQLFVLNSEFMIQRARALDRRLADATGRDPRQWMHQAYQLLYGRAPAAEELALGVEFLSPAEDPSAGDGLSRWEQFALALLSANEFLYVD